MPMCTGLVIEADKSYFDFDEVHSCSCYFSTIVRENKDSMTYRLPLKNRLRGMDCHFYLLSNQKRRMIC